MVAANIMNKVSWKADKGWSSSLRVGQDVNISSPLRCGMLRNITQDLWLILRYEAPVAKGCEIYTGFWWQDLKQTDYLGDQALMGA